MYVPQPLKIIKVNGHEIYVLSEVSYPEQGGEVYRIAPEYTKYGDYNFIGVSHDGYLILVDPLTGESEIKRGINATIEDKE